MIKVKNVTAHAIVLGVTMMTIAPMAVAYVDGDDGGVKDMLAQGKLVKAEGDGGALPDPDKMSLEDIKKELVSLGAPVRSSENKAVLVQRLKDYRSGVLSL